MKISNAVELVFDKKRLPIRYIAETKLAVVPQGNDEVADVATLLGELGYSTCVFCIVDHRPPTPSSILYAHNIDAEWFEGYWRRGYGAADPTTFVAQQSMDPVIWSEFKITTVLDRQLRAYGSLIGAHYGVSIPLHYPNGATFIGKFGTRIRKLDPSTLPILCLMTNVARQILMAPKKRLTSSEYLKGRSPEENIKLSAREIECLQCTGRGLTTKEVGLLLNLSDNTVHGYLTSAMRKLGVTNRVQAIVKSFGLGLIEI